MALEKGGMLFSVLVCGPHCTDRVDRVLFLPFVLAFVVDAINMFSGAKHPGIIREM